MEPAVIVLLVFVSVLPVAAVLCAHRRPSWTPAVSSGGALAVAVMLAAGLARSWPALDLAWLPAWGWRLHFELDPLGGLYAAMAATVAASVLAYSAGYLRGLAPGRSAAYYGWMTAFLASMVGLALAADLLLLFVFFDLSAICSWALIGFEPQKAEARQAALTALLVTGLSSLGFLVGLVLLEQRFGTLQVAELAARAGEDGAPVLPMALILLAALAKSAQVPLHFWLPRAMVAPTPVSAFLHSAAMVAAGVFVLHRLHLLIPPPVGTALAAAGWLSVFTGGLSALVARRLKRILAYSTIAHFGMVAVLLGGGGAEAAAAAAVYVAVHGVAKCTLFLTAGAVTRLTGSSRLDGAGGLAKRRPGLAAASAAAAAALCGLPLTAGFFMEEAAAKVLAGRGPLAAAGGAVALGMTVAYLWRFWRGIFLGRQPPATDASARESGRTVGPALVASPALLALTLLAAGLGGDWFSRAGSAAAAAVHGSAVLDLAFPASFTEELAITLGGWLAGLALIASRRTWEEALCRAAFRAAVFGPARLWDRGLEALDAFSRGLRLGHVHDLRDRVASILLPAGGIVLLALVYGSGLRRFAFGATLVEGLPLACALLATVVAAVTTVLVRSHLGMVLLLSAVGYSVAAVVALLGAPDVALVAVLVETALTLLFVVALARLPAERVQHREGFGLGEGRVWWHTAAALAAGALALAATWAALSNPAPETVASRYIELSPHAHGHNVVAVVLADFRALDTLGEVTVVIVSMLGLMTLLRPRRGSSEERR